MPVLPTRRNQGLRRRWNEIDQDGKGHITAQDLEVYAARNGLPASYVDTFLRAVMGHAEGKAPSTQSPEGSAMLCPLAAAQTAERRARSGASASTSQPSRDREVTYSMFKAFVRSREEGLRRAFNMLDVDADGRISLDDLQEGLRRVSVCCPRTRCIYRCPQRMARQLHSTAAPQGG